MRKCRECRKPFQPMVFWQRYCSDKCGTRVNVRHFRTRKKAEKKK